MHFINNYFFSTKKKYIGTLYFMFGILIGTFLSCLELRYPITQWYIVTTLIVFGKCFIPVIPVIPVIRKKRNDGTLGIIFIVVVLTTQAFLSYKYGGGKLSIDLELQVDLDSLNKQINTAFTLTEEEKVKLAADLFEGEKAARHWAFNELQDRIYYETCEREVRRLEVILDYNTKYNTTHFDIYKRSEEVGKFYLETLLEYEEFRKVARRQYYDALNGYKD